MSKFLKTTVDLILLERTGVVVLLVLAAALATVVTLPVAFWPHETTRQVELPPGRDYIKAFPFLPDADTTVSDEVFLRKAPENSTVLVSASSNGLVFWTRTQDISYRYEEQVINSGWRDVYRVEIDGSSATVMIRYGGGAITILGVFPGIVACILLIGIFCQVRFFAEELEKLKGVPSR